jgi:hypothetical protein
MTSALVPVKPNRIRDEAHAREVAAEIEASGLSVYQWCRAKDYATDSVYRWRQKLRGVTSDKKVALVEVRVARVVHPPSYEVVVANGRSLRLGPDFVDDQVARLVEILERAC